MRFSAPRSISPSPVRGVSRAPRRRVSVFSAHNPSDDESESDTQSEASTSSTSASSDSFCYASESQVPPQAEKKQVGKLDSSDEQQIVATVASIRLHVTHKDPYEEWGREAKKEAFRAARRLRAQSQLDFSNTMDRRRAEEEKRLRAQHDKESAEIARMLSNLQAQHAREEAKLRVEWKARDSATRQRVERAIRDEEARVQAILDAERKKKEEEERKKREAEEKRKEEERQKKEAEDMKKQEEEKRRKEEEERKKKEEEDRQAALKTQQEGQEKDKAEEEGRKALGNTTASEDWLHARQILQMLKDEGTRVVKVSKEQKSIWSKARRGITAKIGQLVDTDEDINRITQELVQIAQPVPMYPPALYRAILSSIAKAVLLQAETEVTASPAAAVPLARVTANLLVALEGFPETFYAKLIQRASYWAVPMSISSVSKDFDGSPIPPPGSEERRKKQIDGKRMDGESETEFGVRVVGMMRVYFAILCVRLDRPVDPRFASPRLWTWCARLLSERALFANEIAPAVLHAVLDVGGAPALEMWGKQWVKMLAATYKGIVSEDGQDKKEFGGQSVDSLAARARARLVIERIMNEAQTR